MIFNKKTKVIAPKSKSKSLVFWAFCILFIEYPQIFATHSTTKMVDRYSDLMRKPAKSVVVYNQIMISERLKAIQLKKMEMNKSLNLLNNEKEKNVFKEKFNRYLEQQSALKDIKNKHTQTLTIKEAMIEKSKTDLMRQDTEKKLKDEKNIEIQHKTMKFLMDIEDFERNQNESLEELNFFEKKLVNKPDDEPIPESIPKSILQKRRSPKGKLPNSVRFKIDDKSTHMTKVIQPNRDLKKLYAVPNQIAETYNLNSDYGDVSNAIKKNKN